ncbi:ComEA family DNA-binding protein [Streptomyces hoynatensis]|uniref:ComEA family DNA-binding protein n=1 Tax=Streptomyces hoynatensis TaxID=1141874 RepID=UPI001F4E6BCC|nr:ComEA family DNA-binding protein [Streptomyces hoynatensis]
MPSPQPAARAPRDEAGPAAGDGAAPEAAAGPDAAAVPPRQEPLPLGRRLRLAVAERLPLWLRSRCGVEAKTLAALCVLLVVAVALGVHHFWSGRPRTVSAGAEPTLVAAPSALPTAQATPGDGAPGSPSGAVGPAGQARVVVDVAGDVAEPGIYTLPPGARVADAIEAAGGSDPGADTDGLNRARVLTDGEQVLVGRPAATAPGGQPQATAAPGKVSLNAATPEQLDSLPGIGPVLARHIVEYRTANGGFTTVDELGQVPGIGDRRLTELRDRVTL